MAQQENMRAGCRGNWSPALFRQMGRELLGHPGKFLAGGFISLARKRNKLVEFARRRRQTSLPEGALDQVLRLQTVALVPKSLGASRNHQRTAALRVCDLVHDCAHSTTFIYLRCLKLSPMMNLTRHQPRAKRAISS